jgi:hypothetical protein
MKAIKPPPNNAKDFTGGPKNMGKIPCTDK